MASLEQQSALKVFARFYLDNNWKESLLSYLTQGQVASIEEGRLAKVDKAIENLRKQHEWSDISDGVYREERKQLDWQRAERIQRIRPHGLDFETAAHFLNDFYALWTHPDTSDARRKESVSKAFLEMRVAGRDIVKATPRPQYVPLFSRSLYLTRGGYGRGERSRPDGRHTIRVEGTKHWIEALIA